MILRHVSIGLVSLLIGVQGNSLGRKFILDRKEARALLEAQRHARANNDLFEEIQKGHRERECKEERCDFEEVRETFEDDNDAEDWWKKTVKKCTSDPPELQCSPENTSKCINKWEEKRCVCKDGWKGSLCKEDVNECLSDDVKAVCGSKQCINLKGSYKCGCDVGYVQGANGCDDVDECKKPGTCTGPGSSCKNLPGSFKCDCAKGYEPTGDGKSCQDEKECIKGKCGSHATCADTEGGYYCTCHAGYWKGEQDTLTDKCNDKDECDDDATICGSAKCENTMGSYTCACPAGHTYDKATKSCKDINECEGTVKVCDEVCTNTPGSYTCSCKSGFKLGSEKEKSRSDSGVVQKCVDVDECAENSHNCGQHAVCKNTEGGHECACVKGYEKVGDSCKDVNECAKGTAKCPAGQSCNNTPGSYTCSDKPACSPGHTRNAAGNCVDIDECAQKKCAQDCVNLVGSYRCTCQPGYTADGDACHDNNECASNPCGGSPNTCTDLVNDYACTCGAGFTSSGKTCKPEEVEAPKDVQQEKCKKMCTNGECIKVEQKWACIEHEKPEPTNPEECPLDNKCDHKCTMVAGGQKCSCWKGYTISCDGHTCLQDDKVVGNVPEQGECPAGFVQLGNQYSEGSSGCFFTSSRQMDRDNAAKFCNEMGASLAKIDNKEQNFYLSDRFGGEKVFWIGAKYQEKGDDFYWPDGTDVKFDRWAENEPSSQVPGAVTGHDQQDAENCVVSNWGYAGHWNDIPCDFNEAFFACSMKHTGIDGVDRFNLVGHRGAGAEINPDVQGQKATDSPPQPDARDPTYEGDYSDKFYYNKNDSYY